METIVAMDMENVYSGGQEAEVHVMSCRLAGCVEAEAETGGINFNVQAGCETARVPSPESGTRSLDADTVCMAIRDLRARRLSAHGAYTICLVLLRQCTIQCL